MVETVTNVTAWSRAFCFRQFQFQKTPSVTVWRELRRIEKEQEFCLFEKIRLAADCGCFASYFNWMGGHRLKQRNRPIKLFYERSENHYQELVKKTAGLTGVGITVLTREKQWTLVKKDVAAKDNAINIVRAFTRQVAIATKKNNKITRILGSLGLAESGGSRFPWTSVNNCTQGAIPAESTGVPDVDTSKLTLKQMYAGSYFEKMINGLNGEDNLEKQPVIKREVEAKPVKANPKFKGKFKYKGLSEFNYKALKKINCFESLRCNKCGNTAGFYGKSCFIYCASCKAGIEY